jgi:hypothetical protein
MNDGDLSSRHDKKEHPALIREIIPIPETRAVIIGAAVGYPDGEAPVNQITRERANPDEFTRWFQ